MTVVIHLDRSDAVAEATGLEAGRHTISYDTPDGLWVQLTYDSLRTQDGAPLLTYDSERDVWIDEDERPFSDIVIEFLP